VKSAKKGRAAIPLLVLYYCR